MKKITVGVDVGGTNVKLGLVNRSGKIIARSRLVTKDFIQSKTKLTKALVAAINDLIAVNGFKKSEVTGVGIGLPGLINTEKGIVTVLPNIPGWRNVPLKKVLRDKLKLPVYIENDVNMITLGEWKYGAGKGSKNMICMTLGTGVGSGLVLENRLYRGEGFAAGELGHVPLNEKGPACNCGGIACFERYVGNKYLSQKASKLFKKKMQPHDVHFLAKSGNKKALKFWQDIGGRVGNGLVGVVNLLNPSLIVVGGGVSNNLVFMKKSIMDVIHQRAMPVQSKTVKIVRAKLADDAGIIGAQVLVNEKRV
ncbi:MAG: ROK family protein [Candidatus Omnitrophica bacterium]|nr:ROK family protein [Candidatus Omnitrophota bacterium]